MAFPAIGYKSILESASTLTATSEEVGFPVENILDRKAYNPWKATTTAQQDIEIDMGGAVAADYIAFAGSNLKAESLTMTLFSGAAFPPVTTKATIVGSTVSDSGVHFEPFTTDTKQYWRIRISASAGDVAFVGMIYLGVTFSLTEYLPATLDPNVEVVNSEMERSRSGNALGAVMSSLERPMTLSIGPAGAEWTTLFTPTDFLNDFWKNHARKHRPFFFNANTDSPTIFESHLLVTVPNARLDRPLVGGRYTRRGFSFDVMNAVGELP